MAGCGSSAPLSTASDFDFKNFLPFVEGSMRTRIMAMAATTVLSGTDAKLSVLKDPLRDWRDLLTDTGWPGMRL